MGSFAPKGHARVDPQHPAAFAICERCGFQYNHRDLSWDVQWYGNKIQKTGFLVCPTCRDMPNPTLRPKVLPPDPVPILNPRTEQGVVSLLTEGDADTGALLDEHGNPIVTETGFQTILARAPGVRILAENGFTLVTESSSP